MQILLMLIIIVLTLYIHRTNNVLKRYTSKTYIKTRSELEKMAIIFIDMRNFTALSEEQEVYKLKKLVEKYYKIVMNCTKNATFLKFLGDGALLAYESTAIALEEIQELQQELKKHSYSFTIGINYGLCFSGEIEGALRHEFALLGDAVNTASRTQGACTHYEEEILLTEDAFFTLTEEQQAQFYKLDLVKIKGKNQTIYIYAMKSTYSDRYELALELYRKCKFSDASRAFLVLYELYKKPIFQIWASKSNERYINITHTDYNALKSK